VNKDFARRKTSSAGRSAYPSTLPVHLDNLLCQLGRQVALRQREILDIARDLTRPVDADAAQLDDAVIVLQIVCSLEVSAGLRRGLLDSWHVLCGIPISPKSPNRLEQKSITKIFTTHPSHPSSPMSVCKKTAS
jgi:hypothetical protein